MSSSNARVIVIGSGAAGMAAAASAAINGAQVTLLEAGSHLGGTTALSGGGLWMPANPRAAAYGVEDSPESGIQYLRAIDPGGDPEIAETYVREGLRFLQVAEDKTPLRWEHLIEFSDYHAELPGGSVHGRSLEMGLAHVGPEAFALVRSNPYGLPMITINEEEVSGPPDAAEVERRHREGIVARGQGLVAALAATLLEHGGQIRRNARASSLIVSGGAVTGVRVQGEEYRGQVIVASGGFERDNSLLRAFQDGPPIAPAGPPTNRGDGLRMGLDAGAAIGNMANAWWVAAMHVPGETIDSAPFYRMLFTDCARPGGFVVNRDGRRFVNESVSYYSFGRALRERDPNTFAYGRAPSWLVFDAQRRRTDPPGPLRPDDVDPDWLARGQSLSALAAAIDVPGGNLEEAAARFNAQQDLGQDEFGRGTRIWDKYSSGGQPTRPLGEGPYYALRILVGCSGTKGGLATDHYGRVRRRSDGAVLPGLYAAGNAAAYPFGEGYPGPGATIGPALVFGWLAGEVAAAS